MPSNPGSPLDPPLPPHCAAAGSCSLGEKPPDSDAEALSFYGWVLMLQTGLQDNRSGVGAAAVCCGGCVRHCSQGRYVEASRPARSIQDRAVLLAACS